MNSSNAEMAFGDKVTTMLSAWLIPGLGHWRQGHRRTGMAVLALLSGTFIVGLWLSENQAVSRDLNYWSFYAQLGVGGATIPVSFYDPVQKSGIPEHSVNEPSPVPPYSDAGLLFCNVAGLLNYLVLLDLWERMMRGSQTP